MAWLDRHPRRERCYPDRGSEEQNTAESEDRDARTGGLQLDADSRKEERGGEEHDREHVVVRTLVRVLGPVREGGGLDLETVGLLRRLQPILRHRKGGLRSARVSVRVRREPRRERRLELGPEACSIEVGQRRALLLSGVDPLNEGGNVNLHLSIRERRDAVFRDPVRSRLAVPLRLLAGPLPRLVGGPRSRNRRKGEEPRRDQFQPPLGAGRLGRAIGCGRRARRGASLTDKSIGPGSEPTVAATWPSSNLCNDRRAW